MERTGLTLPPLILHPQNESISLAARLKRSTVLYGNFALMAFVPVSATLALYSFAVSHPTIAGWLTTAFAFIALFFACTGFVLFRSMNPVSGSGWAFLYLIMKTLYGVGTLNAKRKAIQSILLQKA